MKLWHFLPFSLFLAIIIFGFFRLKPQVEQIIILSRPLPQQVQSLLPATPPPQYLLHFTSSWCGTCRLEHKAITAIAKSVPIIAVIYKDDQMRITNWLKQQGNPYRHIIYDPHGAIGMELGVTGIPETYLIIKGRIIAKFAAPLTEEIWQKNFRTILN
jgi:cytochrome c biogenesis protein CcmG/thiol:disulfide interchange protein DsbE